MNLSSFLKLTATGLIWVLVAFTGCDDDENPAPEESLAAYLEERASMPVVRDSLIACAFGGQSGIFEITDFPVGILFYPEANPTNFQYFETEDTTANPDDLKNYLEADLQEEPFFNGYLRRFLRATPDQPKWGIVSYEKNNQVYLSNPIKIKIEDKPTEYNPNLLQIDQQDPFSPAFTWEDGRIQENVIYFHTILDEDGELVSGTYTLEKNFQFYDLSNVVLNIRDITPPPSLEAGKTYQFVLMGVSLDNWVNLFSDVTFEVN